MKKAVIFYSFDGNSSLISEIIKTSIDADVFEIKTVDTKKRKGLMKFLWGGYQVLAKKKPELKPLSFDANTYDFLVLGTPVWAGAPAPALVSFLSSNIIKGKKLALFCCHGGGMGKTLDKMKALLPGNTIVSELDFKEPRSEKRLELASKITEWVKSFGI